MTESTIAELLRHATIQLATVTDSPRLDAEVLLCKVLDKPREYLYTWPESKSTTEQQNAYNALLERRTNGEPLAYLTGVKEFWSHTFQVTPDTLIPRPETELIVELSLQKIKQCNGSFLDLGTGSGAIAISVAKEMPAVDVMASDFSKAALLVAQSNASRLSANINFLHSDWFNSIPNQLFAVIAANPPYIAEDDPHLHRGGLQFEPIHALRSCDKGFADITAIIQQSSNHLENHGWLLIEHGNAQGLHTRELMEEKHFAQVETFKDLAQNDRVTLGQKV